MLFLKELIRLLIHFSKKLINKKNKITNYLVKVTRKLNTAGRNKFFSIDYFICHLFEKMSQISHHELQHLRMTCAEALFCPKNSSKQKRIKPIS